MIGHRHFLLPLQELGLFASKAIFDFAVLVAHEAEGELSPLHQGNQQLPAVRSYLFDILIENAARAEA